MLNPLYFGNTVISLKIVDSTNNYSTELLKQGFVAEGTVIMAEKQTAGRGQRGNSWMSKPGENLTVSFILKPAFLLLTDHFQLTRVVSLAVADTLNFLTQKTFYIKWPNDIFYGQKKIAGILIESQNNNSYMGDVVAGIGINVNQTEDLELIQATSIKNIIGESIEVKTVLNALAFFLEKRYLKLKSGKNVELAEDYLNHLFGKDKWMNYSSNGQSFSGKIINVTPEGYLLLEKGGGVVQKYDMKEISLLR